MKETRAFIIFSIILLLLVSAAESAYYPDDVPGDNDKILEEAAETYYKAYFVAAANDPTYVIDEKNGMVIEGKATMCSEGSAGPFGALADTVVQRQQLLSVGIKSTTAASGLICDLNVDDILSKSQHPIIIRLWVLKSGSTDAPTVTYFGNDPNAASCSNTAADLLTSIPGGTAFTAADNLLIEKIKILKDPSTVTNAKLTINAGAETPIYFCNSNTPPNLYVAILFSTPTADIYLSYFQVNILGIVTSGDEATYHLLSSSACSTNSECFPGVSCTDGGLCSGPYNPACAEPNPSIKMGASYSIETESCGTYCSKLAKSLTPTNNVCSPLTHVDVTQFASFQSATVNKKISNAYTMGLWLFTPAFANLGTALVNFSMSSLMMISIGYSTSPSPVAYCTPYNGLFPSLEAITTTAAMETKAVLTNNPLGIGKYELATSTDGRWFHVRCGFNLDSEKLYLMMINAPFTTGLTLPTEISLPKVTYYSAPATLLDFPFKNMSPTTQFKVIGADALTTPLFLRQVTVFTDYLPLSLNFPIQYFDFTNLADSSKFKSIWIFGVELTLASATAANVKMYYYDKTNTQQSLDESVNMNGSYSFVPPASLYRLNLPAVNKNFGEAYQATQTTITCDTDQICWNNSKGLSCPAGTFYDVAETTAGSECKAACPDLSMPQLGSFYQNSSTSAYCTYPCGNSAPTNAACGTVNDYTQMNAFQCAATYTKVNWDCVLTANMEKGALLYSRGVGSGANIQISIPNLDKYYLEFWLNIDSTFTPPVQAANTLNFVWYTSGLKIAKPADDTNINNFKLYTSPTGSAISATALTFGVGNWQRIFYEVGLSNATPAKPFVNFHHSTDISVADTTDSLSLTSIMFCNGAQCPCANALCTTTETTTSQIYWYSAFYRNIRIWNSDESTDFFKEYTTHYKLFSKNVPRFSSVKYFFPLNFQNLKDWKITDPKDPTTSMATFQYYTEEMQSSPLSFYQYSAVVDSIFSVSGVVTLGSQSASFAWDVTEGTCTDTNCQYCNSFDCFICKNTYALKDGTCTTNADVQYYLKSPTYVSGVATDFAFKNVFIGTPTQFSVSFFFKMLGYVDNDTNSLTEYDIMRFGTDLKLKYIINTNTLLLLNDQTLLGAVPIFSRKFLWTNISIAYYSDASKAAYYPSMMNFQVNFINVQQIQVVDSLTFDPITIPKESIGLYGKIFVWNKYITGPWAAMVNDGQAPVATFLFQQPIIPCVAAADTASGVARDDSCVQDFGDDTSDILNESKWCGYLNSPVIAFANNGVCEANDPTCPYGYYSNEDSINRCACMTDNTVFDTLILQSSATNKLYCQKLDYIDFGQFGEVTVSGISSAVTEYTIEFWVYIQTYVSGSFSGFDIKWNKQLKISIGSPSASESSCYPLYDSGTVYSEKETIDLPASATPSWVYLRCSVDKANNKFFHYHQGLFTAEKTLTGTGLTVSSSTTTLVFKNNSLNKGIIFFRQIRLWSCYLCQTPSSYKIDIQDLAIGNYLNILHIWDPASTASTTVTDITGNVDMDVPSAPDANWLGYNVLDESTYSPKTDIEAILCLQNANCESLLNQKKLEDVEISVDPSQSGRYTIQLWISFSRAEDLSHGLHVRWKNLIALSFIQSPSDSSLLNMYCWPQDYKMSIDSTFGTSQINALASSTLNYEVESSRIGPLAWFLVRCAVSYNANEFYLNYNDKKVLLGDLLWAGQKTTVPFRYFWHNGEKTEFQILGAKSNVAEIYIRYVNLFNDYIPQYVDISSTDLTKLTSLEYPSLLFSLSFYYNWANIGGIFYTTGTEKNLYSPKAATEPPSDTIPLELFCNPGQLASGNTCVAYAPTDCPSPNAYCGWTTDPFVCESSYYWDETMYMDDTSTGCSEFCTDGWTRSPNSSEYCNLPCNANVLTCPSTAVQLADMQNSFECKDKYVKYGYNCIDEETATNKAYLYFNGCQNFPNASYTVSSATTPKIANGYILTFWIKLDRYNEKCTHEDKRKHYFVFEPHSLYLDEVSTTYAQNTEQLPSGFYNVVYQNTLDSTIKGTLLSFSQWNWNYITIHVNKKSKFINVYSNYHFLTPDLSVSLEGKGIDLTLTKLLFCSVGGAGCTTTASLADISWGAAFYKNLKVFDGLIASPWLALESEIKTYKESLSILYIEFPFNVKNFGSNKIYNTKLGDAISLITSMDAYDDVLFNYSAEFDYNSVNPERYVKSIDLSTGSLTSGACTVNCKICTSDGTSSCLECNAGFKLYAGLCKNYSGYFLKTPMLLYPNSLMGISTTHKTYPQFDLKSETMVTWTIWIKFFGTLETATASCVTIIRLKADGTRYICYSNTDLLLKYYEGTNPLYEDTTFNASAGDWVLLSFATVTNNNPNSLGLSNSYKPYSRFYVNNLEVPRNVLYQISSPGISFDTFDIGNEISALFKDLRFYRSFLVNPYGYVMSSSKAVQPIYSVPFFSNTTISSCIDDSNINQEFYAGSFTVGQTTDYAQKLGISCVADYHPLTSPCLGENEWADKSLINSKGTACTTCPSVCANGCAFYNTTVPEMGCTCNTIDSWISMDKNNEKLYCRKVPQFEVSRGYTVAEQVNVAYEGEYTTEFWFNIYSYNKTNITFESYEVMWDYHNYIKIYNSGNNTLSVHCSPIYDHSKRNPYIGDEVYNADWINTKKDGLNDYGFDETYSTSTDNRFFKWVYVQCSTNIPRKIFQMNSHQNMDIRINPEYFPALQNNTFSRLILMPGYNATFNYGFFFIKELKLWSQWDIRKFTSNCMNSIDMNTIFPTKLLHYFSDYSKNVLNDQKSYAKAVLTIPSNFTGFNLVDDITDEQLAFPSLPTCAGLSLVPEEIFNNQTSFIIKVKERPINSISSCSYKIKETDDVIPIKVSGGSQEVVYNFTLAEELFGNKTELVIELYCDIIFDLKSKSTSYREIIVRKKSDMVDYNQILSPLEDESTFSALTDTQLQYRIEVLKSMQSDLANATTIISPVVTVDKPVTQCEEIPKFCNNRGYCHGLGSFLKCLCFLDYVGDKCQISKNNSDIIAAKTKAIFELEKAKLANNVTLSELTPIAMLIKGTLEVNLQTFSNVTHMEPYFDILTTIIKQRGAIIQQGTTVTNINEQSSYLSDIIGMMLGFYTKEINKKKQENFENCVNYNFTTNHCAYSDYNRVKYTNTAVNLNPNKKNIRLLQTLNINDPNIVNLIQVENESFPLLDLTSNQKNDFVNYYQKIQELIDALTTSMIKMASNSDLDFLYTGSEITINVKKMLDPKNFDFIDYFTNPNKLNKTQKYESFFDAKACLEDYSQNMATTEPLFFIFIGYTIFNRQYDHALTNSSISRMHQIELRNSSGAKVNITCGKGKEIKHYLPLLPLQNVDFFRYYNIYPSKFNQTSEENKTIVYPYYYILPNGTIDHSAFDIQFERYYNKYNIQLNQYLNGNGTFIPTTPNLNDSLVYVNEGRYLVASSNTFGEFQGFSSLKEDIVFEKNFWYLHHPHILGCTENYINNLCFYIFIIIFGLYWVALALLLVLYKCACKKKVAQSSTGDNAMDEFVENLRQELQLIEKDNERGGENRYTFLFPDQIHGSIPVGVKSIPSEEPKKDMGIPIDTHDKEMQTDFVKLKASSPKQSNDNLLKEKNRPKEDKDDPNLWLNKKDPQNNFERPEQIEVKTSSQPNQDGGKYCELKETPPKDLNVIVTPTHKHQESEGDVMNKDDIRPLSEKKKCYNPLHFIVSRNIYANIFELNSPFVPRYLFVSKFMCLWYLLFDLVTILMVFVDYNLQNSISFDSGVYAGYIVFAVFAANIAYILISWCITTSKSRRIAIMNASNSNDKNELQKLMSQNNLKNLLSIILVNLFTFGLCALLWILSVGYCAVWSQWAHVLVLLWLFTLIADVIIMEILLELFILLFYLGKSIRVFNCIHLTLLAIKQLRNFD